MLLYKILVGASLACAFAWPAAAYTTVYVADLSGLNESPPNASSATGWARVTIDSDARTMSVEASFAGLLGNSTVAHIHCCTSFPFDGNAGVATMLPTFPEFPNGVTSGSYNHIFDMTFESSYSSGFFGGSGGTIDGAFSRLVTGLDEGTAYFNLHSSVFPGGEIRGFPQPIPEPATTAQMLVALAGFGALAARRRRQLPTS